ncbi:MAG: flagellar biosynthetic protein FliO [Cyanobacteria bacterium P01_H01_bin.74]
MIEANSIEYYLGSFILYTFIALGVLYLTYWLVSGKRGSNASAGASGLSQDTDHPELGIESSLALSPVQSVYVIRNGDERFLVSNSNNTVSLLSRLEPVSALERLSKTPDAETGDALTASQPWYQPHAQEENYQQHPVRRLFRDQRAGTMVGGNGFQERFLSSIRWLIASRTGK